MIFACLWAPVLEKFPGGVYEFIQKFWGFLQPGIVAAFFFGILWKKVPSAAAVGGMLLSLPVYGFLIWKFEAIAFLHHMAITFLVVSVFITIYTLIRPLEKPVEMPVFRQISLKPGKMVVIWSICIFLATVCLYVIFR